MVTALKRLQEELQRSNLELESAYEELQSSNEELETTNEELQSTVEELETTNEELQSTNEELETMNEELQSTNEELQTMNDELRTRSTELNSANSFLESVFASLRYAVVVIDNGVLDGLPIDAVALPESSRVCATIAVTDVRYAPPVNFTCALGAYTTPFMPNVLPFEIVSGLEPACHINTPAYVPDVIAVRLVIPLPLWV